MKTLKALLVALTVLSVCSLASAAEFWEDFESYAPGSALHGQGGWAGWDGTASAGSPASDAYAYSGSTSVEIIASADLVQPFTVAGGLWSFSAMMYAPSGGTGETMFIVLNEYTEGGDPKDWSIQTTFNLGTAGITSAYDDSVTGTILFDQWVEFKLIIDLDNNTVDEYYNGEKLFTHDWDDDPATPPGIGCVDLFGNGASSVYYDDFLLIDLETLPIDPSPADGAVDVARDIDLAWTAGIETVGYDVYLGTDFDTVALASRTDAMGVLVAQDLATAGLDLDGLLEFGLTYYWRIDPVRADGVIDKGQIWSFEAEPFLYEVQGVVATTNGNSSEGQGPENAVNGSGLNAAGQHVTDTTQMWTAEANETEPTYILFEFDDVYPIGEMRIWNHNFIYEIALGVGIKDATVEYSLDGIEWMTLGDVQLNQAPGTATYTYNTTVPFDGTPAKFVRLTVNSVFGISGQLGLSEVRFVYNPTAARYPVPADGATDVDVTTALAWRPGREAVTHDVYLGTDPEALALDGTATEHTYSPALDLDTTYYWQIDEVNEAETTSVWSSDVWTFTTEASIMVDDFESYTDDTDADEAIWQTWVDGLDNAANGGSMVGNDPSPFAEKTVVYSGGQSMPLFFDNSDVGYSETTRTFSPAQDWSQHGITTLAVRFKGDVSYSAAEKLYVKVNGTKVVYAGDVTAPIWQTYNVDLTSVNANLSSVSTLTIGIQGTGQGVLYVDTIALYAVAPQTPPADGDKSLVAHWKLDETSGLIAADSSGYGNDGALVGMEETQWTTGVDGGALEFAGNAANPQYIDCGTPKSLELAGSVTISAWVKMNEANDGVYMGIGGKLSTDPYTGFCLVRHSSNVFRLWANSATNELAGFDASSDVTYTDTEWHHVAGVVDDGTSKLYVDGVKQAIEGSVDLQNSPGYFCLGKQYNVGENHRYWLGLMDDVRVYYRALSAQEIAGL